MRAMAQMISYEVPLLLLQRDGRHDRRLALAHQNRRSAEPLQLGHLPHWFVFTPWGLAGFVMFMIAATAESNRSPFDLPEGESELIAGYHTEYSGFKFALFFLGEYLGHVFHLRIGHDALSGRLDGAACVARLGSVVDLVLLKADDVDLRLHLDARNAAAPRRIN